MSLFYFNLWYSTFVCLCCLVFPWVPDSLTEACTWRATGGGSTESWRGGRPWRTWVTAQSAPSPKPLKWTLQTRLGWIKLCQKLEWKTRPVEKEQQKTRVVLTTQSPVLVMLTEQCVPSFGYYWEVSGCTWGQGPWGQTDSSVRTQQSDLYLLPST